MIDRFFERLAALQLRQVPLFVLVSVLIALSSWFFFASKLGLDSSFTALLPEDKPSVRDLELTRDRMGGLTTLTVAIQSKNTDALRRFAGDLVPRLQRMQAERVFSVDWNIATYADFVYEHRHLYADLDDLARVRDQLSERLDYERCAANPFCISIADEPPDPQELIDQMQSKAQEGRDEFARFPGGYYIHPDGDLLVVYLRTDLSSGDFPGTSRLLAAINTRVRALRPSTYAPDLRVAFAGELIHAQEEHRAIIREATIAGVVAALLIFGSIVVFFRKTRSFFLLFLSLSVPILVTFAFTQIAIGSFNMSTAFLVGIVIGNGINPMIIWLARYFEERRRGLGPDEALPLAHKNTWAATLTASLAASIAYGSLVSTDFRGFRDFGIIGGTGMLLGWLGTFLVLPAFTLLADRIWPMRWKKPPKGTLFGRGTMAIVRAAPRAILAATVILGIGGASVVAWAIVNDPIEYDFRKLRSVQSAGPDTTTLNRRAREIRGHAGAGDGIALLVPDRAEVGPLRAQLEHRRDHQNAPYGAVRSIDDLLPDHQPEKLAILANIRSLLLDLRPSATEEQQRHIDEHIPPEDIARVGDADLPEDVARPFTERDGTRGRILYIENQEGPSTWDGRYLVAWAGALREATLRDGSHPPLAGRAPVFADMIEVVWTDGPKAVLISFLAVALLVVIAFRRMHDRLITLGALLFGVVCTGGFMAILGIRLNFLNFVAFPITFGIGVDYGVNVVQRYVSELKTTDAVTAITRAVEESGGSVMLCSLTTIFGYISLYASANQALNSFGAAMTISEIACLLGANFALPAFLLWRARRTVRPTEQPGARPQPSVAVDRVE